MHSLKKNRSIYIFLILALLVLGSNYTIMVIQPFEPVTDTLILASLFDLTIVLPLFFYLFVVRNRLSTITLLPVVIAGFWFAYFIVPHHDLVIFDNAKYGIFALEGLFIAIELFLAAILLRKIPALYKNYKKQKEIEFYYPSTLRMAMNTTFGHRKLIDILVYDFSILYYGFFSWKKKWDDKKNIHSFTIHTNSGYFSLFIMLVHAMVIEVIAVHFLIAHFWSPTIAWIFTALDLYALLWIIADYQAVRLSPLVINDGKLFSQVGIRREIVVDLKSIKSIQPTSTGKKERAREKNSFAITLPNLFEEEPQFEIELIEPAFANLPFGIKKEMTKLYVTVDDKEAFLQVISSYLKR
ncbi:hypothetical protein E1I69_17250 [Bacillus timonensis]|uniref:Beta-carotene 15,15'-monooxygenase n=1 Tax=Bacillus timonensis TaxID=1033734 RepID=A0A4S3PNZ2_9BACI|nr:hypothetical protein [Bacillus timonensis]THE10886.1 hypothetical protein E1I69_17250 [Bacillus timonensis]